MSKRLIGGVLIVTLAGCVSVPPASRDAEARSRQYSAPPGKAALYVYRTSGRTSDREVLVDGHAVGDLVGGMFLYVELDPGRHEVAATGAMNNASLVIQLAAGQVDYVRLNTPDNHWGVYISHSKLILMPEATGRQVVAHSRMAASKPVPAR